MHNLAVILAQATVHFPIRTDLQDSLELSGANVDLVIGLALASA